MKVIPHPPHDDPNANARMAPAEGGSRSAEGINTAIRGVHTDGNFASFTVHARSVTHHLRNAR
jgi:hypothetical protein